ncbi:MAG TPA: SPFH domain-containing protein [Anaerolineales bacterium]|nr:SPFH domain-containing protein [Anaerolineales bacterium]
MNNKRGFLYEFFRGTLRLLFVILGSLFFAAMCAGWVEGVFVWEQAEQLQQNAHRLFKWIPVEIWVLRVPLQSWDTARYLLIPLSAFFMLFMAAVLYVRDIYHLPTARRAFHYVFASLFGFFYPVAYVDGGKIDDEDPDNETNIEDKNLIRAIGGPGFVRIQPGNAVAFRDWHGQQGIGSSGLYFLRPFEMIARVVSLEDQHGHIDDAPATTTDGVRIRLKNIDYRFCVLREERKNRDSNPYPFSASAVDTIAYSFAVSDKGQDRWQDVVQRTVTGALTTFISSHDLDYLTAPRRNGQNPRRELRIELFADAVRESLRKAGTELQWMDIGYFDIDELKEGQELHLVDQTRTRRWATNLIGDARTIRSYGEAKRLAYQELARAEAQAEMIISITDSLRNVSFGSDQAETLRHIFLARTAQILESLQDRKNGKG